LLGYGLVMFFYERWFDLFKLILGECSQQCPGQIKRLLNTSIFINPLVNKFLFKVCEELQVFFIIEVQSFLPDDSLHCLFVFCLRIEGIKLVRNTWVIGPCHFVVHYLFFYPLAIDQGLYGFHFDTNSSLH